VLSSGELAALGTATAWTGSSLAMEGAARRIGSLVLNVIRLVLAFGLLSGLAMVVRGVPLPVDATVGMWGWLAVSGWVGFVFGDLCLFRALAEISARLTMLIQTTAPIFAALLGWAVLGERMPALAVVGLVLVVGGVAWAIAARTRGGVLGGAHLARGVVLALCGALGQAGGLVLSKRGLGSYSAVSGTQIRVLAAVVGFAVVVTAARAWPRVRAALRDRAAMKLTVAGALLGPCIGVSLSLYAVAHAPAGVAAALMATPPILVLPVAWWRGERVGVAGVVGAVVAVAGVALIVTA
jgi:drug/metabolite transporter (DMT)-like permease